MSQILLDGKGMDPNFYGRYKIKVDDIIKGFVEKDKVRWRLYASDPR